MKLFHISDLHIGKRVSGYSLISDQRFILKQILILIYDERPDLLLISGDVYDSRQPSAEAVELMDDFLRELAEAHQSMGLDTCIISGNHDSAERLSYAGSLIDKSGIHISPVYDGSIRVFSKEDGYGQVNFYLMPYLRPADVRRYFGDQKIESYNDAIRTVIEHMEVDEDQRNVILAHQFVTGASTCDSEEIIVGGLDNISTDLFLSFDYAALGHIHGPQNIGSDRIRYCGTPLKYSLSERDQTKSVTIVELGEKGSLSVTTRELEPRHDMRQIRGLYNDLMRRDSYEGTKTDDYIGVVLTDEDDVPGAIEKLRVVYPNIIKLSYDNKRARALEVITEAAESDQMTEMELFSDLYLKQNGQEMNEEQRTYLGRVIDQVKEGEQ